MDKTTKKFTKVKYDFYYDSAKGKSIVGDEPVKTIKVVDITETQAKILNSQFKNNGVKYVPYVEPVEDVVEAAPKEEVEELPSPTRKPRPSKK
jgi:hypothetical protein